MAEENPKLIASSLSKETICCHLRLSPDMVDEVEWAYIQSLKQVAIEYIETHCARTKDYIDEHEDLAIATLILISDMYDERGRYVDSSNLNRTVETIISHHDQNFIGKMEVDTDAVG